MPLRLDGTVGEAAARAARFAGRLKVELSVPVFTQDERLTSFEAEEVMVSQGLNRKQRRDRSDQLAASIILRDFLSNTKQKMR
jgi:putative Holliday junction resolvase